MKRFTITVLMFSIGLFIISLNQIYGFHENTISVFFDDNSLMITTDDFSAVVNLDDFEKYFLIHSDVGELDTHLIYNDLHLIIFKTVINQYVLEALITENGAVKTYSCLVEESIFLVLREDAIEIDSESNFGYELRSSKSLFEEHHFIDEEIMTMNSLFPNENISISEMTSSDKFIDGYRPTNRRLGVPYHYHDSIVNIVPENWFYTLGTHVYFGREYALYVTTRKPTEDYFEAQYISSVNVYDIEVGLPFFNQNPGSIYDDIFQYSYDLTYSIKPVITMEYASYVRSVVGYTAWTSSYMFDPSSETMIIPKNTGNPRVAVAPISNVVQINPSILENIYGSDGYGIRDFTYSLGTSISSSVENKMRILNLKSNLFQFTEFLVGYIVDGVPLGDLANTASHLMLNLGNQVEMNKLNAQIRMLDYEEEDKKFFKSFAGGPWSSYPEVFAIDLGDFRSVFSSPVLGDYIHQFTYSIESFNMLDRDAVFDITISNKFNFFDHLGNIVQYNGVNREVTTHQKYLSYHQNFIRGDQDKAIPFNTGFFRISQITESYQSQIYNMKSNIEQVVIIHGTSSTLWNAVVEVYNQKGQMVTSFQTGLLRQGYGLLKLNAGEFYNIVVRYEGSGIGNVTINVEGGYAAQNKVINNQNMSSGGLILNNNSSYRHYHIYRLTFNTSGIFNIHAYSSTSDTTLRLYDMNGNLVSQSFDPLADWGEDYPDLNAKLRFHENAYPIPIYYLEVSIIESNRNIETKITKEY